jgi:isoleucyl-tRNA synthetase
VRNLSFTEESDQFVEYSIRPNLPSLGPRFGKEIPSIRRALESMPAEEIVRAVDKGDAVRVELDGRVVDLAADDILVSAMQRGGYASMANNGYLVALDTELTPELVREGFAREVVRRINDWRKEAGFNVEDRISVVYEASEELARAIEEYRSHIQDEVLATSLSHGPIQGNGFVGEAEFGGQGLQSEIRRVDRGQS